MIKFITQFMIIMASSPCFAKELISIPVGVIAPYNSQERDYSEKMKASYQASLFFAMGELNNKLRNCGYKLSLSFDVYPQSDKLAPKELASDLERQGVWIILGPSRSDQYLIAKTGLSNTALISPLASSTKVTSLSSPYWTMHPTNQDLAKAAAIAVRGEEYGDSYGIALDQGCLNCRDFALAFERKMGRPKFKTDIDPDNVDISELKKQIEKSKVDFLLLPNYSRLSGYIVAELKESFPQLRYVGGDGWGNGNYGFFTKHDLGRHQKGFCVRLGAPPDVLIEKMSLQSFAFRWKGELQQPSTSSVLNIEFMRKFASFICKNKPKSKHEFLKIAKSLPNDFFRSDIGIGVYKLKDKSLIFDRRIELD